jgi:hypothetical protein
MDIDERHDTLSTLSRRAGKKIFGPSKADRPMKSCLFKRPVKGR